MYIKLTCELFRVILTVLLKFEIGLIPSNWKKAKVVSSVIPGSGARRKLLKAHNTFVAHQSS